MKIEKIINYDKNNKEGILPIWAEALYKRQGKDNKNNFLEILLKFHTGITFQYNFVIKKLNLI